MTVKFYCATTKYTREHPEHAAAANLEAKGYEVYLPMRYERNSVAKAPPLASLRFTGYIFIALDVDKGEHGPINSTRGIGELLCRNDETRAPIALRPGVIETLRKIEHDEWAAAAARVAPTVRPDLHHGALVRITRHANFAGQTGLLASLASGMATILIGPIMLTVADCDIEPAIAPVRKVWAA